MASALPVEKVLCINHPESEGRMAAMHKRFKEQNLQVELSPGMDPPQGKPGYVGCLLAHQKAVQRAKNAGCQNVLIFEDDVIFLEPWVNIEKELLHVPDDFDIVRFSIITDGLYRRKHVSGRVFRCWEAYGTQCYLLSRKCFDSILSFPLSDPYDEQLGSCGLVQYVIHPLPMYHELGSSLLGNIWMQVRDDFPGPTLSRSEAADIIDAFFLNKRFQLMTQMRIIQGLDTLRKGAHTQEIRFFKRLLESSESTREEAIELARALFTLATEETEPTALASE